MDNYQLPNYIEIETSQYCNRLCDWCPNVINNDRKKQSILAWNTFTRVIEILKSYNYSGWLAFHNYNEPLANPRILKEIKYVKKNLKNAKLAIYTNGDYLSEKAYNSLMNLKLDQIRITLYPLRTNNWESSENNIIEWLKYKSFLENLKWRKEKVKQGIAYICMFPFEIIVISPNIKKYYDRGGVIKSLSIRDRRFPCNMTSHSLSIEYTGAIKMCCNVQSSNKVHSMYIFGNVQFENPIKVWNSELFNNLRKKHQVADWSQSNICKTCSQTI